jgi:hypothetical protein
MPLIVIAPRATAPSATEAAPEPVETVSAVDEAAGWESPRAVAEAEPPLDDDREADDFDRDEAERAPTRVLGATRRLAPAVPVAEEEIIDVESWDVVDAPRRDEPAVSHDQEDPGRERSGGWLGRLFGGSRRLRSLTVDAPSQIDPASDPVAEGPQAPPELQPEAPGGWGRVIETPEVGAVAPGSRRLDPAHSDPPSGGFRQSDPATEEAEAPPEPQSEADEGSEPGTPEFEPGRPAADAPPRRSAGWFETGPAVEPSQRRPEPEPDRDFGEPHMPGRPAGARGGGPAASTRDWPTVSDILAAQGARPKARTSERSRPSATRSATRRPAPTASAEPGSWSVPLWLGWLPTAAVSLGLGGLAAAASWAWTVDAYNAGVVAERLGLPEGASFKPLPEGVAPGRTSWWATTATHLVQWAAFLDRHADRPADAEEARELIRRAAEASPLQATARFALAHPLPGDPGPPPLPRSLGQSRDVVALTWAGRQLLADGRKAAALRAYRDALEMAARTDLTRPVAPAFLDDAATRRYALPSEDLLAGVVRDLSGQPSWSYKDWEAIVPRGTAAPLVVARVLRDLGSGDAEAALDAVLAETDTDPGPDSGAAGAAVRVAARAEALALKGRWAEAEERYREAIELMPVDVVQRAWWFNVADLALRRNDDSTHLKALEAAKNTDLKDEVTLRAAVALQKEAGPNAQRPVLRTARAPVGRP